jgi:hypothetical protein
MVLSEFPSGGRYEVRLEQIIILLRLRLQRLGSALVRLIVDIHVGVYRIGVDLVDMCGCFTDVTGSGFRRSKYRPIGTAGQHTGIKPVRACGSGNRRIRILGTSIRRVHLRIPALDILSGMRCPLVEVLVLGNHSLGVHSGQIHDLFGCPHIAGRRCGERTKKRDWVPNPIVLVAALC